MRKGKSFPTNMFFIVFLATIVGCTFSASGSKINDAVLAINNGQLLKAKTMLGKITNTASDNPLERAIAYKHLGTVLFRLGDVYLPAFDASMKLFEAELQKNPSSEARKQYGFMLYQKANCLLTDCENKLSQAKLQGIQTIPFQYLKNYLNPATEALRKAKGFYPGGQLSDIYLLEVDLILAESHLWEACRQTESAQRARTRAMKVADLVLKEKAIAPDVKKKLLLRKAMLLMEIPAEQKQNQNAQVQNLLKTALYIRSGNTELDLSVFSVYAKFTLNSGSVNFKELENDIRKAIDQIEELRTNNLKDMDFTAKKNYFTTRTGLYETLMMLYAKQNRPFDMLLTINQIRSRALQDIIVKDKITKMSQLQQLLLKNRGMLVAYYVGCDHIWTIQFTGDSATISQSKRSGQELTEICWNVISVYSDMRHIQAYMRYGNYYNIVPQAFNMSHVLYEELFKSSHLEFTKKELKHLYILPSNVLNYLPFATLAVKTDGENVCRTHFVADDSIPITYLATINGILDTSETSKWQGSLVLARGEYSYPATYNNNPENPDDPTAPSLNLPNVANEGKAVAKILNTSPDHFLQEKSASEYNLVRYATDNSSVIHIASHAHLSAANPLESYVVLTAGHGEDGKVKVRELLSRYRGKIKTDLVVLSACDTNRGENKLLPGDDIAALSNAFLVAGAKNVIATEWPASDMSFPKIMEQFYLNLASGQSKDVAMAKALKLFLSQDQNSVLRYPVFWGNIVLTGGRQ